MHLKLLAKKLIPASFVVFAFSAHADDYVKFSNKPVSAWNSIFSLSENEKFYTVQAGDTLYDISETLFGSPTFWPKIWSLNSKITNPHIIEKGMVIYFVGGSQFSAPQVGVRALKQESYTYGNHFLSPEIPPAGLTRGPISLPDSLPNLYQFAEASDEADEVASISVGERAARNAKRLVELTSELTNKTPVSVGKIKRVFTGSGYAVIGDVVYISSYSGVNIGDELAIYRLKKNWLKLKKPRRITANLVEWIGAVQIKSTAEGGYVAEVVKANSIIQVEENLALRKTKYVELPKSAEKLLFKSDVSSKARIVGSHRTAGANVVGESQIVYMDGGANAGLTAGKIYPLYANFGEVGISKPKKLVPKRIGFVKIASVERAVSTGVAFNLISEVQTGQVLGLY